MAVVSLVCAVPETPGVYGSAAAFLTYDCFVVRPVPRRRTLVVTVLMMLTCEMGGGHSVGAVADARVLSVVVGALAL